MKKYFVYGLQDPFTKEIKYVGASITPLGRLRNHIRDAKFPHLNYKKAEWISGLIQKGVHPNLCIFSAYNSVDEAAMGEVLYYDKYKETTTSKDPRGATYKETWNRHGLNKPCLKIT